MQTVRVSNRSERGIQRRSRRQNRAHAKAAGSAAPRDGRCPYEALEALDGELAWAASSSGALRLAMGEGLERVRQRSVHHEMGFSSIGAYARERCNLAARTAEEARSLARRLETLPRTRAALLAGEIVWAMAVLVARVASAEDETEWLSAARRFTVRQMREQVRAHRQAQRFGATGGAVDLAETDGVGAAGEADITENDGATASVAEAIGEAVPRGDLEREPTRMKTLTVTVDAIDAWTFECARWLVERISGGVSDEEVMEALLGEGETSLLPLLPRESITEIEAHPRYAAQRAWEGQLAEWRREAEVRCEAQFHERNGRVECSVTEHLAAFSLDASKARSMAELDAWLREIAREIGQRDLALGRLAERLWKADGWRRLGYATEQQYASERLGLSLSAVKDKRWLARRLRALPEVAEALCSGQLGSVAARLVARVATLETSREWIACATERTVKHLREEVKAAELIARLVSGPCVPPARETLRELHQLEAMVTSGAAFGALRVARDVGELDAGVHAGQMSAGETDSDAAKPPVAGMGQMSAAEMAEALGTLVHAFDTTRRAPGSGRHLGRITLRLRVSEASYWHYRSREQLHRRYGPPGPFMRFLCWSLFGAWKHALTSGVQYEHIYARDRFRCASPVCTSRNVTLHHLTFRSHGGDDRDENLLSLCVLCRARHKTHYADLRIMLSPAGWSGETPVELAADAA